MLKLCLQILVVLLGTAATGTDLPALPQSAIMFLIFLSRVLLMQDGGWSNAHRPPARAKSATTVVARLPAGVQVDILSFCGLTCLLLLGPGLRQCAAGSS